MSSLSSKPTARLKMNTRIPGMLLALLAFHFTALAADTNPDAATNSLPPGGRITAAGQWIPANVQELQGLSGSGPFIRLADGSILTVSENSVSCKISKDDGKTWVTHPIFDSTNYVAWSPVLIQTRRGVLILAFSNGKEKRWTWNKAIHDAPGATLPSYTIRSLDGGKTWRDLQKLHEDWTGMNRDIKETRSGSVVLATMMLRHNPGRHAVVTYTTKDDGKTWVRGTIIDIGGSGDHAGAMESTLEQLKNGRLWMLLRTNYGFFWDTYSDDDGITWSEPKPTSIDASSSPGALQRLASGRLVLVWNRCYPEGKNSFPLFGGDKNLSEVPCSWHRGELAIMFSSDDAKSWTKPVVIAKNHPQVTPTVKNQWDAKKWLAYPFVFEAKPGELWVTTGFGGVKIKLHEKDFVP